MLFQIGILLLLTSDPNEASIASDPSECASGISLWYDGSSVIVDASGTVTGWTDKSGNGNDATILSSTGLNLFTETIRTNELYLNGEPVLTGTGSSEIALGESLSVNANFTIFSVCKYRDSGSTGRIIQSVDSNFVHGFTAGKSGVAYTTGAGWVSDNTDKFGTDWLISSQTRSKYRGNGNDIAASASFNPAGAAAIGRLRINSGLWSFPKSEWSCAEIIVYNNQNLDDDGIQCIENYLACKYGLDIANDPECKAPITTCNATDINTFNWDILTTQGPQAAGVSPPVVKDFSIDESDLSLNIKVKLQYFGNASADDQDEAKFGVTYVLDFEDYDSEQHAINEPGTCQNRNDDDFVGKDFVSDYWQYSLDPVKDIGTSDYLAYPPPMPDTGSWSVTMDKNDTCGTIIYTGKFSWSDLRGCTQYGGGESYTNIITDDNWLNMTGTFYINLVSPFWYDKDFGYYRDYQLLNQPFVIAISSVVNILGSTGINLMTMSVISVYNEDEDRRRLSSGDGYTDFKLIFLTECSDYLELNVDGAIGVTFDGSAFSNSQLSDNDFNISDSSENNGCINNKGFICSQLWQITATSIPCTDNSGRDFSGNYAVTFTPQCRSAAEIGQDLVDDCNTFLANHPQLTTGDRVALSTDLVYKDEICDPIIFTIHFEAEMTFYDDNTFSSPVDDSKLFQVGEDTIYVQINVSFPSGTMDVFETELIQVHICTFNPLIDVEANYNDPNDITNFGCFVGDSNIRDTDYDKYFYQIYQSDPNNLANPRISLFDFADPSSYSDNLENAVRFSFKIPNEVARDTLYVMAEVEITLQELGRRRVLLNARSGSGQTANQIQHFVQKVGMKHGREIIKQPSNHNIHPQQPIIPHQPYRPINAPITATPATYIVNLSSSWIMAIGGLLGLALTFNIIYMTYQNYCIGSERGRVSFIPITRRKKKGKYSKVNGVDSEFNSDVAMIQNEVDELQ